MDGDEMLDQPLPDREGSDLAKAQRRIEALEAELADSRSAEDFFRDLAVNAEGEVARLRAVVEAARAYRQARDDESTDARGDDDLVAEENAREALYGALAALDVSGDMGGAES